MAVRGGKAFRAILASVRRGIALLWLVTVAGAACGDDDGLTYTGTAGVPIPARFDSLIPDVAMRIDGAAEERFLCDTGSPVTFFDTTVYPGAVDGKHRSDLEVFGLRFPDFPTVSWNAFADDEVTSGLIGGDLLGRFAFGVDYQGNRVWLGEEGHPVPRPGDVRAAADVTVPFELEGGGLSRLPGSCPGGCGTVRFAPTRILVRVRFEAQAQPVWAIVDTGATAVTVEDTLYASLGGARPELEGIIIGTVSGNRAGLYSRVWRLALGDVTVDDVPISVVPGIELFANLSQEVGVPVQVFVGGSFLRHFLTTIDYPEGALRLGRYDDPTHIPAEEFVGIGMTLRRDGDDWVAFEVYPEHDAYRDGVRGGDVVEEIDGTPITGQPGEVVDAALGRFSLGQEVPMSVSRLGTARDVRILVEDLLPSLPPPT
jgi:hypothetical protein